MRNFIKDHIIKKIEQEIENKGKITKQIRFYYFDDPVKDGSNLVNRVSRFNPFNKEEILPIQGWYALSGSGLIRIYDRLKNNKFHFFKMIDGKSYKTRLKKDVKYIK